MSDSKFDKIIEMVKKGIHTRDEIKAEAECSSASLASYFASMRNMAKYTGAKLCPMADSEGLYKAVTYDEMTLAREEAKANSKAVSKKTPEERLELVTKRIDRLTNALGKAKDRHNADPDNEMFNLRMQKIQIELRLAEIDLENLPPVEQAEGPVEEVEGPIEEAINEGDELM